MFCGKQTSSWHGTTVQAVQPRLNDHDSMPTHRAELQCITARSSATHGEYTAAASMEDMQTSSRHLECTVSERLVENITRKRSLSTRSPYKSLRSPIPKLKRRARTGTEGNPMVLSSPRVQFPASESRNSRNYTTLDMQIVQREKSAIAQFRKEMDTYTLLNYTHCKDGADTPIMSVQEYMAVISPVTAQKSNVVYMEVLDAKSESKDTLMTIIFDLHERFIERQGKKFLVLAADGKLFEVLQSLKYEYGEELNWVLLFPVDWHMLKNYQYALMKPYFDMGLKELARVSGYPVAAIQACSQFKRTHHFLIEALYLVILQRFIEATTSDGSSTQEFISKCIFASEI